MRITDTKRTSARREREEETKITKTECRQERVVPQRTGNFETPDAGFVLYDTICGKSISEPDESRSRTLTNKRIDFV